MKIFLNLLFFNTFVNFGYGKLSLVTKKEVKPMMQKFKHKLPLIEQERDYIIKGNCS